VSIDNPEFPIFFTTANKTDELPGTLGTYLKDVPQLSRMWVGKREMERLRKRVVGDHGSQLLIPEFTAKRSKHSDIPAKQRPEYDRTVRYWADDGLEMFRHMKTHFGVLPTNIQFELPDAFKFQITQRGVFTSIDEGLDELSVLLDDTISRLDILKNQIDTADYDREVSPRALETTSFSYSKPWAIDLESRPAVEDIQHFEANIAESNLEFKTLDFQPDEANRAFDAELMDKSNYGRTDLRTKEDSIRVYPNGGSFLDESIRIYNFVNDHIDPNLEAVNVA
jgi:hypothetical protein